MASLVVEQDPVEVAVQMGHQDLVGSYQDLVVPHQGEEVGAVHLPAGVERLPAGVAPEARLKALLEADESCPEAYHQAFDIQAQVEKAL